MSEFDQYAAKYQQEVQKSISFLPQQKGFEVESKKFWISEELSNYPGKFEFLDFGCGIGTISNIVKSNFPLSTVTGVDVSSQSISVAKELHKGIAFYHYEDEIPVQDNSLDFVTCINVLHHIEPERRTETIKKIHKKLKKGGKLIIIEHNLLNPLTRLAVKRCPFDEGVKLLPRHEVSELLRGQAMEIEKSQFILFFPWQNRFWQMFESILTRVPLGAQHFTVGKK